MSREPLTTVTILTPAGRGAVATVCVDGPRAAELVDACFAGAGHQTIASRPVGRIAFGTWRGDSQSHDGPGEELVVCLTRPTRVEIHCHGGQAAVENVVTSLTSLGATVCEPSDWALQHSRDAIEAAAKLELASAKTERALLILLDQHQGALRIAIEQIIGHLQTGDKAAGREKLDQLLGFAPLGMHLTSPWRIAIVGPPNVGKSSLMNRLTGYERSIVFDQPGTTRDLVTATTAIDGWPIELVDTAGLRHSADEIESAGVALAMEQIERADLVLQIVDATSLAQPELDPSVTSPRLVVLNKCDLCANATRFRDDCVRVSALTGDGIDSLLACIAKALVPIAPDDGQAVPFTSLQIELLKDAFTALQVGNMSLTQQHLASVIF